jgi:hypothetical protein
MPTKTKAQLAAEEAERARKARTENNDRARHDLKFLIRSITQGEWLSICRQLDLTRDQIGEDENLMLLAAAWVKEKRKHGTASFDVLLELTDRGLLEFHGYQLAPEDEDDAPAD